MFIVSESVVMKICDGLWTFRKVSSKNKLYCRGSSMQWELRMVMNHLWNVVKWSKIHYSLLQKAFRFKRSDTLFCPPPPAAQNSFACRVIIPKGRVPVF